MDQGHRVEVEAGAVAGRHDVARIRNGGARIRDPNVGRPLERNRRQIEGVAAGDLRVERIDLVLRVRVDRSQAGEAGQLYGSVNARDIAAAFTESGVTLDRQQIRLEEPLKTLGLHKVTVALHPEVEVTVTVNVARSQEEADIQAGVAAPVAEEEREPTLEEELEALI